MEVDLSAPPVVAVVVTYQPGDWLEETLGSLAAQDHPNLSVLVIDAASADDPTARIAAALPGAFVRRVEGRMPFGRAANEVLHVVEGASHFLFCHDDVVLAPDATRLLLDEALRSNAGLASPKLVDWDRPERLLAVGLDADWAGVTHGVVERGELDQAQHDSVRDTFVAPGAATLVRADLFAALGGFYADVAERGEDLDLSWRAHLAGARVIVVPAARVRHLEATTKSLRPGSAGSGGAERADALADQHRIRTVVSCSSLSTLLWMFPLLVLYALGEAVAALLAGQPGRAAARLRSPLVALGSPRSLRRWHRQVQQQRQVPDRQVRRQRRRRPTRRRAPGRPHRGGVDAGASRTAPTPPTPPDRAGRPLVAAGVLALALAIGARHLLGHELPTVAQIPSTSGGPGAWWRAWWSTWQPSGVGAPGPSSPALGLLAVAGTICLGAGGTLQAILVLGPLVIGPLGAYRAARWWGSQRGGIAALVAYAVVPLPYNALGHGHWNGLLAYAAAPWLVGMLGRVSGSLPYPATHLRRIGPRLIGLGLLTALVGAFVPSFVVVVAVVGGALAVGSLLVAQFRTAARLVVLSVGAAAIGFVLLLPWSLHVVRSQAALFGAPGGEVAQRSFASLLRMRTGVIGAGPLGWGLLAAAALPLVIGRSWRLAWAARLWFVVLACVGWAWMGLQGWVPVASPEVVLAPAGAALAASVGLGMVAFDLDLPGYRFGWRQGASAVAAVGLALGAVPFVGGLGTGRWDLPRAGSSSVLVQEEHATPTGWRLLWIGAPDAIPMASTPLGGGQAWATSYDGAPATAAEWSDGAPGGAVELDRDIRLAEGGLTTDLGHLLAPLGVRYLVLPNHNAPSGAGAEVTPTSAGIESGLSLQTDLTQIPIDPNYTLYANSAWVPRPVGPVAASLADRAGQLGLVAVAAAAILVVAVDRRRRVRSGGPGESVRPEWFAPLSASPRRTAASPAPAGRDSDEVWSDA